MIRDLRFAVRGLRRNPGFTAVAVLTLGLGIGATTAMFTVVHDVVLQPLPYAQSERLVSILHPVPGLGSDWEWNLSSGGYFFFRENANSLDELGVYSTADVTLSGGGAAEEVRAAFASASLFEVLRARPVHGRMLLEVDNRHASSGYGVAVLGYEFWRTRFGADPGVIGATIEVEGSPVGVVGVAEPGLTLPDERISLWLPMYLDPGMWHANWHWRSAIARLAEGVPLERAQAELARLTDRLPEAVPTAYGASFMESSRFSTVVRPLRDQVVGDVDRVLWILLGGLGVVLLIAAANVANLFLVRLEGRHREIAILAALGAGRWRLARRYMSEGVLVALGAGGLALLLADGAIGVLLALSPTEIPRLDEVAVGWQSVAFVTLISLLAGAGLGALPSWHRDLDYDALRAGGRGMTASRRRHVARGAIVSGQVALSLVLLAAAGLLLQTFRNLRAVEAGVDPEGVLTVQVSLPSARYGQHQAVASFVREVTTRVGGLPGVQAAGATTQVPLGGGSDSGCSVVFPEGWKFQEERYPCVHTAWIAPGYFGTLGIPVQGREPDWAEIAAARAGVVVSRAFAERVWPGQDPIGKGLTANQSENPYFRVVGVAGDVRGAGLDQPPIEVVYFPLVPVEGSRFWSGPTGSTLVIKSATKRPQDLTTAIRRVVSEVDPGAAIGDVRTMEQVIASHDSIARVSFAMILLAIAAGMALLLGAVGLYGVMAYVVGERTTEIGIRLALGAQAREVREMVVRQSLTLVTIGIVAGLAGALGVTRVLRSLLFGVRPVDPLSLAAAALLLVGVAALASWLPARRAASVDPMIALRAE